MEETKEERYVVALALSHDDGKFLFCKRRNDAKEYQAMWSLPTLSVSDSGEIADLEAGIIRSSVVSSLTKTCFGEELAVEVRLVKFGIRQRSAYRIHLYVALGMYEGETDFTSKKYQKFLYCDIDTILDKANRRVGTCLSIFIQYLVEQQQVDSAIQYLELSPDLCSAMVPLEEYSERVLWELAADNYAILKDGENGSDGEYIRTLSLDRFLDSYVSNLTGHDLRILDLGCGGGELVSKLTLLGHSVTGVDLCPDPLEKFKDSGLDLRQSPLEGFEVAPDEDRYQLVIMNLVCQWIRDMNVVVSNIDKAMCADGRILMTLVPPEFCKNGRWQMDDGKYDWLITEPVRRKPFLAMINRTVGPFWYYPRTLIDYINLFSNRGFACLRSEYLFVDSSLDADELADLQRERPDLMRHQKIPVFVTLEFRRIG